MALRVRCSLDDDVFGSWGRALLHPSGGAFLPCAAPPPCPTLDVLGDAWSGLASAIEAAEVAEVSTSCAVPSSAAAASPKKGSCDKVVAHNKNNGCELLQDAATAAKARGYEGSWATQRLDKSADLSTMIGYVDSSGDRSSSKRRRRPVDRSRASRKRLLPVMELLPVMGDAAIEARSDATCNLVRSCAATSSAGGECEVREEETVGETVDETVDETAMAMEYDAHAHEEYFALELRHFEETRGSGVDTDISLSESFGALCDVADLFDAHFPMRVYHGKWRRAGKKQAQMKWGKERPQRRNQVHRYTSARNDAPARPSVRPLGNAPNAAAAAAAAAAVARNRPAATAERQNVEWAMAASMVTAGTDLVATRHNFDSDIGLSWAQIAALQERELTPEDYETLLALDERVQKKTMDAAAVDRLAARNVTAGDVAPGGALYAEAEAEVCSCRVCLCEYAEGEEVKSLPCGHVFHAACIDHWLKTSSVTCPLDGSSLESLL